MIVPVRKMLTKDGPPNRRGTAREGRLPRGARHTTSRNPEAAAGPPSACEPYAVGRGRLAHRTSGVPRLLPPGLPDLTSRNALQAMALPCHAARSAGSACRLLRQPGRGCSPPALLSLPRPLPLPSRVPAGPIRPCSRTVSPQEPDRAGVPSARATCPTRWTGRPDGRRLASASEAGPGSAPDESR
jgi:hypothetical protein